MNCDLDSQAEPPAGSKGVNVADKKNALKEKEAGSPNCRGSSPNRQKALGDQWLNPKQ